MLTIFAVMYGFVACGYWMGNVGKPRKFSDAGWIIPSGIFWPIMLGHAIAVIATMSEIGQDTQP